MDACQGEAIALPSVFSVCQARNVDLAPSEDPAIRPLALAPSGPNFYHKLHKFPGSKNIVQAAKK